MDGSHFPGAGSTACGGLIRDATGNFLRGFHCKITSRNVIWAELWGVLSGLQLARTLKMNNLIVEADSITAISLINKGFSSSPALHFLVGEIRILARQKDWHVMFQQVPRSANACADHLANKGHLGDFYLYLVEDPWPLLSILLQDDV